MTSTKTKGPEVSELYCFLKEIRKGQLLGMYSKKSMRFDELYRAGTAFLYLEGIVLDPDDDLVKAGEPPEPKKKKDTETGEL